MFVIIGVLFGTTFAALMKTKALFYFFNCGIFLGTYLLLNSNSQVIKGNKFNLLHRIVFGLVSGLFLHQWELGAQ